MATQYKLKLCSITSNLKVEQLNKFIMMQICQQPKLKSALNQRH